jgi:anaerobic magnesium-protoporphyrin IX monomethyl ester cyclase
MKILLISPIIDQPESDPPTGLCYLQAYLDKMGFTDNKILCLHKSYKKIEDKIKELNPDIVGVSCFTEFRRSSLKIAKMAKGINPNIKVVLGGPHATFKWAQIMENFTFIDFVVIGEGELTFYELVNALDKRLELKDVKGIVFRKNGEIIRTEPRPFIENLDELPFPSYRDIDFNNYKMSKPPEYFDKRVKAPIVSSRGCVFDCNFCSATKFWSRRWRSRTAKNVVDEIEMLNKNHDINFFAFYDDIFTANKKRVIEICQEIINRKLDITWYAESRVDTVSKEMLEWMKRAGCSMAQFGVESGSETILKNMNKKITPDQIINAFALTKEAGIKTEMLLMVGYPGETGETLNETKTLIKTADPDVVVVSITKVLPSTQLFELAKSQGFINDDYWLSEKVAPEYTVEYTMQELLSMRLDIMKNFYKSKGTFEFYKYLWLIFKSKPRILTDHLKVYLLGKETLVE